MDLNTSLALQGISLTAEKQTFFPNDDGECGVSGGNGGNGGIEMGRGRGRPFSTRPLNSDQNNNNDLSAPTVKGFSGSRSVRIRFPI